MWIIVQRGKYYSEMDGDIYALLCRQYAADGKPAPVKVGECETYQAAREMTKQLQQERRANAVIGNSGKQEGEQRHADDREVGGCAGGGDPAEGVAADAAEATSGEGNPAGVESGGGGGGVAVAERVIADVEAAGAVEKNSESRIQNSEFGEENGSRLDARDQGLLPALWAQSDVLAGVKGGEDRLPVFTGERFCAAHPREAQIMVNLRFVYGFGIREVAKILGCSPQTVSNVCRREVTSKTAKEFREAMAARLRSTVSDLLEQVQERVQSESEMLHTSLKDVVTSMEKTANLLQQMETDGAAARPKDAQDPEHAKEMEGLAQDYLARLKRVEPVEG
jgi:predicted transcriptional regulator